MKKIPSFSDYAIRLSEAQVSALNALAQCRDDKEAARNVEYHIRAWDKALGRDDTIEMERRKKAAQRIWDGYVFEHGLGI